MQSNGQFKTIMTYRPDIPLEEGAFVQIDVEDLVVGLQSLGVKPVQARTDGKKLVVDFLTVEVEEPYRRLQQTLAGVATTPLLVDYSLVVLGKTGWKGLITMMRNFSHSK